jgi:2-oxo-3-(phosphooxy)propyl 3-oxoalkanoate synthase
MPATTDSSSPPMSAPGLSFAGSVDRALIHRRNAGEAFLTDAVQTGPHCFVAAALLPAAHPHYAAHTGPSRHRDPMLLLECARQAETYAAHTMFGVEPDACFVLRNWSAEFAAVAGPGGSPPATGTAELLMTAVTGNPRLVGDRIRGLEYELELWAAGARIGRVCMEVGYVSATAYAVIRSRKHRRSLPSSDDLIPARGCPVAPARVGRVRATDALLLDVAAGGQTVTAALRVPVENPSLFDHAQDHIPAMVLVEAARQLAALATHEWGGAEPDHTQMTAMSSSFGAYAELGEPVEMTATPVAAAPVGGQSVGVTFCQAGTDIAQAQVVMAAAARPTDGRERRTAWLGPRS